MPHADVARSDAPDAMVETFFEETYAAATTLADWDRVYMERA